MFLDLDISYIKAKALIVLYMDPLLLGGQVQIIW